MLPHEKELVERLEKKPFALIGINSDQPADLPEGSTETDDARWARTLENVRRIEKENGITWRNAVEGSTRGVLPRRWNIQGWPTIFVLDQDGVIRHRGHDGQAMEAAVLELLATIPGGTR